MRFWGFRTEARDRARTRKVLTFIHLTADHALHWHAANRTDLKNELTPELTPARNLVDRLQQDRIAVVLKKLLLSFRK